MFEEVNYDDGCSTVRPYMDVKIFCTNNFACFYFSSCSKRQSYIIRHCE